MQNEAVRDHEGLRRAAWIVVWILTGLLAFVSLIALGRVLRDVVGSILFSLGGFDIYAGIFRVGAMLFVVLAALLLPVAIIVRLVRARRARSSGGQQGVFWPPFDIPLLILAALLVLAWSALTLPTGRWPRSGLTTPWDGSFYLGLVLLAGGIVLLATDPRIGRTPRSDMAAGKPETPAKERKVREGSHLGAFTLGALLIIVSTTGLLAALGIVDIDPLMYPALILTILGAGMFVGTWVGRARWLTILCVMTLPFVAAANIIGVPFTGSVFGDVSYAPSSTAELQSAYHLGVGTLRLDLSALGNEPTTATTSASLSAGELWLQVPSGIKVVVDTSVRAGEIYLLRPNGIQSGETHPAGVNLTDSYTFGADSPGLLHVSIDCGVCTVEITTTAQGQIQDRGQQGHNRRAQQTKKEKS